MTKLRVTEFRSFQLDDEDDPERIVRGRVEFPAGAESSGRSFPHVLIAHGFKGFMHWGFFPELSRRIASQGCIAVSFNMSGSGIGPDLETFTEEEAFAKNSFSRQLEDLNTVRAFLQSGALPVVDCDRGAVFGHSMGGGMALLFAPEHREFERVATWAAISKVQRYDAATIATWRADGSLPVVNARTGQVLRLGLSWLEDIDANADALDIRAAAANARVPTLLVHGTADESVAFAEAEVLAQAGSEHVRLEAVAGAGHTFGARHPLTDIEPTLDRVLDLTVAHLVEPFLDPAANL